MKKRKYRKSQTAAVSQAQPIEAFTFGEPSAVLDRRDILDYAECIHNGRWIEPPINFSGLAKSLRAAVHHSSPIYVKRNILVSTFIPHPLLSQQDFSRFVLDYLVFGNAFLEKRLNRVGGLLRLESSPAKYTRRGVEDDVYWFVQSFKELVELGMAERIGDAVPAQVLPEWCTCGLHHVRNRCGTKRHRRRQVTRRDE
jgi:capsid portal protein